VSRRALDASLACLPLNPSERLIFAELRAALGIRSDADLLRVMATQYCHWQDVPLRRSDFALRSNKPPKKGHQRVSEQHVEKAATALRQRTGATRTWLMVHLGVKVDTVKAVLAELKERGGLIREHDGTEWVYRLEVV
jgi:hypothetical protein